MRKVRSLSVVIPAFNERERIEGTLMRVIGYLEARGYDYEVIVVDDGSRDDTVSKVEGVIRDKAGVRLISGDHRGKGFAVRQGMLAASKARVLSPTRTSRSPSKRWRNSWIASTPASTSRSARRTCPGRTSSTGRFCET